MSRKAVFLDRDGVINRAFVREGKPYPPAGIAELEILPGVAEALQRLSAAGYYLAVVTNQPDVSRGKATRASIEAIHDILRERLPVDEVRVCYHDDRDECPCRKPAPGMILDAAREAGIDLPSSYMVGDRWRDVEAGRRAGCVTVFVDHGYTETEPVSPDLRVSSLAEAADRILSGAGRNSNTRGSKA